MMMMIDTITIRIHNVRLKYSGLYEQFYNTKANGTLITEGYMRNDSAKGTEYFDQNNYSKTVFYSDSGKFIPSYISTKLFTPSFNYGIAFRLVHKTINDAYLDMEFSIPKYLYGTNVFQLISYPNNSEFNFYKLIAFIDVFFRDNFNLVIAKEDIQVKRLDFCFNQWFRDLDEKNHYLISQAAHMSQYCGLKGMRLNKYERSGGMLTGWSFKTARYSFKVYDKGIEFRDHDLKELENRSGINKGGRLGKADLPYDMQKLTDFADNCLRYELTLHNSGLHALVAAEYFEKQGDKDFSIYQSNLYQKVFEFDKTHLSSNPKYQRFGVFTGKRKMLALASDYDDKHYLFAARSAFFTFDYGVYKVYWNKFWELVQISQVQVISSVPEMVRKINDYNEMLGIQKYNSFGQKKGSMTTKGYINLGRLLIPALLSQYHDLRELKDYLPRATFMRLKQDFKRAGIPFCNDGVVIHPPTLGYEEYNNSIGYMIYDVF